MCLFVDTNECSVAEEDITVYKYVAKRIRILEGDYANTILNKDDNYYMWWRIFENETLWVSPYRERNYTVYKPGETVSDPNFQCTTECFANYDIGYCVFYGLHTFAWSKDAILRANTFAGVDGGAGVMECVIPKGARYWTNGAEYCSETLVMRTLIFETDKGNDQVESMVKI